MEEISNAKGLEALMTLSSYTKTTAKWIDEKVKDETLDRETKMWLLRTKVLLEAQNEAIIQLNELNLRIQDQLTALVRSLETKDKKH